MDRDCRQQPDDATLLRQFTCLRDESAFAEIVQRHLPMVCACAQRQLAGDSGLAAEVAQSVFIDLARKAPSLSPAASLAPWLHRATRLAVLAARRADARRLARERQAAALQDLQDQNQPLPWEPLRPLLDESLLRLSESDRELILISFFEQKNISELASVLTCTPNAARMRLSRALERLRKILARRGFHSSLSVLEETLRRSPAVVLPPGLAPAITAASISALGALAAAPVPILPFMASTHTKIAVALLTLGAVTAPLVIQQNRTAELRRENVRLQARLDHLERAASQNTSLDQSARDELTRLREQKSELLKLRGDVTTLRHELDRAQRALAAQSAPAPSPEANPPDERRFIPESEWSNLGYDTPERAFQSFLATLKSGDPTQIASTVHFDVQWRPEATEDDRKLVEKSMGDYLVMLDRARGQLSAFHIDSVGQSAPDRQRIFFSTATPEGQKHSSSFEMIQIENQWKPILSMRWLSNDRHATFATSPVFGPEIDLERPRQQ